MTEKIIVVKKKTTLQELVEQFGTRKQAEFYIRGSSATPFSYYEEEHDEYCKALDEVIRTIRSVSRDARTQTIFKQDLPTFQFGENDLVIVVGGEGLFINTAKYLPTQTLLPVNYDRKRSLGVLACCNPDTFKKYFSKTLEGRARTIKRTLAQAKLNDGQVMLAINDLFIGVKDHTSAFYSIKFRGKEERHSSSGIIVSTGTGSTAWQTSILLGAYQICKQRGIDIGELGEISFPADADLLKFTVREPFPSKRTGTEICYDEITPKAELLIWLLEHYPCLFLGYSGWDFEHLNYRRFWERAGKTLKKIYWNRRPGEIGGPKFSEIFYTCKDREK
jgi:NAD kinase